MTFVSYAEISFKLAKKVVPWKFNKAEFYIYADSVNLLIYCNFKSMLIYKQFLKL